MKKQVLTSEQKVYNLCVESAKNSSNGYTFSMKEVCQMARKKYKMNKQTVADTLNLVMAEHPMRKGNDEDKVILVELEPKKELPKNLQRYNELKETKPNCLILFRMGDFYEAYEEDAQSVAEVCGCTVTKNVKYGYHMAGFPYHALDTYLRKLVRKTHKKMVIIDPALKKNVDEKKKQAKAAAPAKKQEKVATKAEPKKKEATAKKEQANGTKTKKFMPKHATMTDRPGYGRFLTLTEALNIDAKKKAQELYPEQFKSFGFARIDTTNGKEYKNASEAHRSKADMNNLLYVIKVVEGVQYTGKTRINAYENFLAAETV